MTSQAWLDRVRLVLFLIVIDSAAAFSAQRTFVSAGTGNDSNPCSRPLPCRNFTAALALTDPGGEIVVLDSGGYGPVSISKSVALIAPRGVHAAITAFSGDGVQVIAGISDTVILRGLYISGLGGVNGIDFESGKTLHVEDCVVSGFSVASGPFTGVGIYGRSGLGIGTEVHITNTVSRQNRLGFLLSPSGGSTRAHLWRVNASENSSWGITAGPGSRVVVRSSVAAGNGENGFYTSGSSGVLTVEGCTATFNQSGIRGIGATRVRNTMVTANGTGILADLTGTIVSFGGNRVDGNTTNGSFTSTSPPK